VVAVKVGFPTLVRTKAPPVVEKDWPELKVAVPVIGPIDVVRSYVKNAELLSKSIALFTVKSEKPTPPTPLETLNVVSVKFTGEPPFTVNVTVPTL